MERRSCKRQRPNHYCADYDVVLGSMLKGDAAEQFTVKAEFVNRDDNNAAMQAEIEFDLQVYATQKTNG